MDKDIIGYKFEDFYFDVEDENDLKLFGGNFRLYPDDVKDLRFLKLLIVKYPGIVEKQELDIEFEKETGDVGNYARHAISRLRIKFNDKIAQRIFHTVHGIGYKLGVKFEEVYSDNSEEVDDNLYNESKNTLDEDKLNEDRKEIENLPISSVTEIKPLTEGHYDLNSISDEKFPENTKEESRRTKFDEFQEKEFGIKETPSTEVPPNETIPSNSSEYPPNENEELNGHNDIKKWIEQLKKQFWTNKFNSWLLNKNNRLAIGVLVVIVLSLLLITLLSSFHLFENSSQTIDQKGRMEWLISLIQAVIILIAIIYGIHGIREFNSKSKKEDYYNDLPEKIKKSIGYLNFNNWSSAAKIAEDVWKEFKTYWQLIFINWALLYISLAIRGYIIPTPKLFDIQSTEYFFIIGLNILITTLNNASSLFFYLCFNILNTPTNFGKENKTIENNNLGIGVILIVLFLGVEGLMIKFGFSTQSNIEDIIKIFDVISGIIASVSYSLLFSRLQSKFLNSPSWLIGFLFTYASIQPLFFILNNTDWAILLMISALIFKSFLFLNVNFLFQSGKLLFYLIKVRKNYQHVEEEFEDVATLFNKN